MVAARGGHVDAIVALVDEGGAAVNRGAIGTEAVDSEEENDRRTSGRGSGCGDGIGAVDGIGDDNGIGAATTKKNDDASAAHVLGTALHVAARHDQAAAAQALLARGALPRALSRTGATPLLVAGLRGHVAVAKLLAGATNTARPNPSSSTGGGFDGAPAGAGSKGDADGSNGARADRRTLEEEMWRIAAIKDNAATAVAATAMERRDVLRVASRRVAAAAELESLGGAPDNEPMLRRLRGFADEVLVTAERNEGAGAASSGASSYRVLFGGRAGSGLSTVAVATIGPGGELEATGDHSAMGLLFEVKVISLGSDGKAYAQIGIVGTGGAHVPTTKTAPAPAANSKKGGASRSSLPPNVISGRWRMRATSGGSAGTFFYYDWDHAAGEATFFGVQTHVNNRLVSYSVRGTVDFSTQRIEWVCSSRSGESVVRCAGTISGTSITGGEFFEGGAKVGDFEGARLGGGNGHGALLFRESDEDTTCGVGDEEISWAVDGIRGETYRCGKTGKYPLQLQEKESEKERGQQQETLRADSKIKKKWEVGDVVGVAVNPWRRRVSFATNGNWMNEGVIHFDLDDDCDLDGDDDDDADSSDNDRQGHRKWWVRAKGEKPRLQVSPAVSSTRGFVARVNLGNAAWEYEPPPGFFELESPPSSTAAAAANSAIDK